MTKDEAERRQLVGVMTIGRWNGRTFQRARYFRVTSTDDARTLAQRITQGAGAGRPAVHVTALAAGHQARCTLVDDAARMVRQATAKESTRRGWLWTVAWYPRAMLDATP